MEQTIKDFFDGIDSNGFQYITRQDFIGGEIYVHLRKVDGNKVLSIGGEDGEIDIKCVDNIEEVNEIIKLIT